jgi:hypothetical protein
MGNQVNQVNDATAGQCSKDGDPQRKAEQSITYLNMQLIATGTLCGGSLIQTLHPVMEAERGWRVG